MTILRFHGYNTFEEFVAALEANAHEHSEQMRPLSRRAQRKYVRDVVRRGEIVFAIWPVGDDHQGIRCIKGINATDGTRAVAAVFVQAEDDALGMWHEWGDGADLPSAALN